MSGTKPTGLSANSSSTALRRQGACKMSKKVYILGAGSSVHVIGPLNTDWIERIKKNNENLEKEKTAIDFLNGLPGFNNLEVLLSLIDLSIIEQHNYLPL